MTAAATVALSLGMSPESLIAAALNALNRLVTDPSVAHETARRAADSILRYLLQTAPAKDKPGRESRSHGSPDSASRELPPPLGEGRGEGHPVRPTEGPSSQGASRSASQPAPTPSVPSPPSPARDDARLRDTTHAATRTGPPPRK